MPSTVAVPKAAAAMAAQAAATAVVVPPLRSGMLRAERQQVGPDEGQRRAQPTNRAVRGLLEQDRGQDDGEDRLQLLQQDHDADLTEIHQEQRLDDGEGPQDATREGDESEKDPVDRRSAKRAPRSCGYEHRLHQQERHRVEEEHHEGNAQVEESGREDDAVEAP